MSLYATFSADGLQCLGIYDTLVWPDTVTYGPVPKATKANPNPVATETRTRHAAIPAGAVEITEDQRIALVTNPNAWQWTGKTLVAYVLPAVAPSVPASAALSDWRIGVMLWNRMEAITASIEAGMASSDGQKKVAAKIANERLQYANTVMRSELSALKDAFGFSQADVDESMWRAAQVARGDLTGIWPLDNG